MINTVIFDLDGLLVDTERTWYHVWNDMLGMYGHSFTIDDYVNDYSGKTVLDNVNLLIQNYQLPITTEEGVFLANSIEAKYIDAGVALKQGAEELLSYLKENHYKIVAGTSSLRERAIKILESTNTLQYFNDVVVGYDVKRGKPFPDTFLEAAKRVNAFPMECLVLEDSEMGIQAAYAAEMKVICVPDLKYPKKELAEKTTAICDSLKDVIAYLEQQ